MFVSFHNARLTRGGLPNTPVERGSLYDKNRQSKHPKHSPSHWQHLQVEREVSVLSQAATLVAHVQWSGSLAGLQRDPWYSQVRALGVWSSEFLLPTSGRGPTHISVHMESLPKCPDLWFWAFQAPPQGIPTVSITNFSTATNDFLIHSSIF